MRRKGYMTQIIVAHRRKIGGHSIKAFALFADSFNHHILNSLSKNNAKRSRVARGLFCILEGEGVDARKNQVRLVHVFAKK